MSAQEALDCVRRARPDLILLDLHMSGIDGFDFLEQLRQTLCADEFLPVLVVTADPSGRAREQALSLGATDFLAKPFELFDITLRVRNLLQSRFLHLELMERNRKLEGQIVERTGELADSRQELKLAQLDVIDRLALVGRTSATTPARTPGAWRAPRDCCHSDWVCPPTRWNSFAAPRRCTT
jgi:CheY-like chemotaxis protein